MMWQVIVVDKMAFLTQPSLLDVISSFLVQLMCTNIWLPFKPLNDNSRLYVEMATTLEY